ncbi:AfsR/SARP family transcriptional regulator [Actinophytocola sediminis]
MRIQVLGPLRVWHGDDEVDLGPPARRAVLGLLLLAGGEPVSRATLVDTLWGERPPPSAVNVLQTHVKHLRRLLEPGRPSRTHSDLLPHVRGGYALHVPATEADLPRFRQFVAEANAAHRAGDTATVAAVLAEALGLWRGRPLADVPLLAEHPTVRSLSAERRAALARYGDAMIATGRAADVLVALAEAATEQPLDEPTQARLIRAHHAVGQRATAFETFHAVRARLADELGVDPGPDLTAAHAALLRDDEPPAPAPARPAGPAQLPPDVHGFTGRAGHLSTLDTLLRAGDRRAVAVAVVSGAGGVGKTALAVHWAHHARERFPDGQLYANLRGHSPGAPPARPIEVLARFLPALGVPAEQVPTDLAAASALYRTMLADRRVLVVLDNAARPDQVRPLLPSGPGCAVLVTSRDRMVGLVAVDGARALPLDVLAPEEAQALLTELLGEHRVRGEQEAVGELAKLCVFLPLALRIAAANLAGNPGHGIADQVLELREGNPLTALEVHGDEQAAVRGAFELSYAALPAAARRLFRLLGLVPGTDIGTEAAAAVVAAPDAGRLLDRLAGAHLVEQHAPGRFRFHDLLRRYAIEQATAHDREAERASAIDRLLDWYLSTVDSAARVLYPHMLRLPLTASQERAFAGQADASGWLDSERANIVAAVRHAAVAGPYEAAWLLADALRGYFWLSHQWVDWLAVAEAALAAARTAGAERAQAAARLSLADLCQRQSRYREAVEHYARALVLARRADWPVGHAAILVNLGCMYWQAGRLRPAVAHLDRALAVSVRTGQLAGQAVTLANLSMVHWERGELRLAERSCVRALELHREVGSRYGEAITLGSLARVRHALGQDVRELLDQVLTMHREAGDRYGEADTRRQLAAAMRDAGRLAAAHDLAHAALALARDLGDPRTETESLHVLATVEHRLGRQADAVRHLRAALELARETGERYPECDTLVSIATVTGDRSHAHRALAMANRAGYGALAARAAALLDQPP